MKLNGKIKGDAEFKYTVEDFEMSMDEAGEGIEEGEGEGEQ